MELLLAYGWLSRTSRHTESFGIAGIVLLLFTGGLVVGHADFQLWLSGHSAEATVLERMQLESPTGQRSWRLKLRYIDAGELVHPLSLPVDELTHDRYVKGESVPLTVLDGAPPTAVLRGREMNAKVAVFLVSLVALLVTLLLIFTALTTQRTGPRRGDSEDETESEDAETGQAIGGLVESGLISGSAGKGAKDARESKDARGAKGARGERRSRRRRMPSLTTAGLITRATAASAALAVILSCWTDARIAASGRITEARFEKVLRMVRRGRGPSYAIARFSFKQRDGTVAEFEDRGTSMIEFKPAGTSFKAFVVDGSNPAGTIHLSRPGRSMIYTLLALAFLLIGGIYTFAEPLGLIEPSDDDSVDDDDSQDEPVSGESRGGAPKPKPGKDKPAGGTPVKIQLRPQRGDKS